MCTGDSAQRISPYSKSLQTQRELSDGLRENDFEKIAEGHNGGKWKLISPEYAINLEKFYKEYNGKRYAMKCTHLLLLVFCCSYAEANDLCLKNEKNIFSFETKSGKILSLCKGENGSYLTYRFGKTDNVELQFPNKLDGTSWKRFEYSGVRRGGGKVNAGFGDYSLAFEKNNIGYSVFQEWNDEDDSYSIGVIVSGKGKPVTIIGLKDTQEGSLVLLEADAKQLPNTMGH